MFKKGEKKSQPMEFGVSKMHMEMEISGKSPERE